jgi:hypothetical protein
MDMVLIYKSDGFTSGIHQKSGWYDNTNFGLNASSQYSTGVVLMVSHIWFKGCK